MNKQTHMHMHTYLAIVNNNVIVIILLVDHLDKHVSILVCVQVLK